MALVKILWVDDEIESLQSQKLFLESKGYEVHTLTNGFDAIDYVKENLVDVVLINAIPCFCSILLSNTSFFYQVNKRHTTSIHDRHLGSIHFY